MSGLRFKKYEGLGNDFIVVDQTSWEASKLDPVRICDRHWGVGADGVLLMGPGRTEGADGSMIVLNADGSRPEMCGNGLRCVALALVAQGVQREELLIDTDSGTKHCHVHDGQISIEMGIARRDKDVSLQIQKSTIVLAQVSMGNPHAITFEHLPFDELAPGISVHEVFPQGVNVEFVRDEGDVLDVRVWERGAGPTLACGTGACAVAVEACLSGRRRLGEEQRVRLPGGELRILVRPDFSVRMTGPARLVFSGEIAS